MLSEEFSSICDIRNVMRCKSDTILFSTIKIMILNANVTFQKCVIKINGIKLQKKINLKT